MKFKAKFKQTEIGMIPEDWEVKKLSDVCSLIYRYPTFYGMKKFSDGVPVIRGGHILPNGGISEDWNNYWFVSKEYSRKFPKTILKEDDVIMSVRGSVGTFAKVAKKHVGAQISPNLIRLSPDHKKLAKGFLFYSLKTRSSKSFIIGTSSSSAVPAIRATDIKETLLPYPQISEQTIIAKILSDLDSKIELSHQMNKTLEAIGKSIFKHWFIDFEFPNDEDKPYKSSGGGIVYNKELGKEMPKGWTVIPLNGVAEFTRGFSYSGSEKSKRGGEHVFITLNSVKEGGGFKREFSYITSDRTNEKHFVHNGEIVIANTEQTKTGTLLGCPALVEFPLEYKKDRGVYSHHITKAKTKLKNIKYYLYYHLFINQQNAVKYNTGSVIWGLDVSNWSKNEKIILPHQKVLAEFELIMENIFLKTLENNLQIETLSHLRDSLVLKLMSGKIRVPVQVN